MEGPAHRGLRAQGLDKHPLGTAERHKERQRGGNSLRISNTLATSSSSASTRLPEMLRIDAAAIQDPFFSSVEKTVKSGLRFEYVCEYMCTIGGGGVEIKI